MSLTSQLDDPSSPLSGFLEEAFPGLGPFCAEALDHLPAVTRAIPDRAGFVPWATTGTAIDHRLRLAFTADAVPGSGHLPQRGCSPIDIGVMIAAGRHECHRAHADTAGMPGQRPEALRWERIAAFGQDISARLRETAYRLRPHEAAGIALPGPDESELCSLCYAASWFDELAHRPDDTHEILNFIGNGGFGSIDDVLAVVPRAAVADLINLVRLAAGSQLAPLRASATRRAVTAGPLFSGGADVGGADGDLIVAGTLIDIKATVRPGKHLLTAIRQLLGYLLIDYTDQHGITAVGVYLARQGELITWNVRDLLPALDAVAPLDKLRRHCRETLRLGPGQSPE